MAGSLKPVIWFGQFLKIYHCPIQQPYRILGNKSFYHRIVITKRIVVQARLGTAVLPLKP